MRIIYITAQAPYGPGEQFILTEIINMEKTGFEIEVIPVRPENLLQKGSEAAAIAIKTIKLPMISIDIIIKGLFCLLKHPIKVGTIVYKILFFSGTLSNMVKNLLVLPKGLTISRIIKKKDIKHIHAHWASTPSTMAFIASYISGIPWSMTTHRGDIVSNNMCRQKAETAKFIRTINTIGYNRVVEFIGKDMKQKCKIVHCGVNIPEILDEDELDFNKNRSFIIGVPASLYRVKGHIYLLQALSILKGKLNFICNLYGDGYLKSDLERYVAENNLQKHVIFNGSIPHDQLLNLYYGKKIDCIVLPSILTDDGEHEGIPVSLMEAMAYRIPVISTNTGGIPELLAGIDYALVEQKHPHELADAIFKIASDRSIREKNIEMGYQKVYQEFNNSKISIELKDLINCKQLGTT